MPSEAAGYLAQVRPARGPGSKFPAAGAAGAHACLHACMHSLSLALAHFTCFPSPRRAPPRFFRADLQTLMAVQHMHRQRVIHRDLKLGNLFLSHDGVVKVGDFGLACRLEHEEERKLTLCGTPNSIAPEVLGGSSSGGGGGGDASAGSNAAAQPQGQAGHSFEVDMWALGVVLYAMLVGRPPFETADVKATYQVQSLPLVPFLRSTARFQIPPRSTPPPFFS